MDCTTITPPPNATSVVIQCIQTVGGGSSGWQYVAAAAIAAVALAGTTFFNLRANRKSNERTLQRQLETSQEDRAHESRMAKDERLWGERKTLYLNVMRKIEPINEHEFGEFNETEVLKNHYNELGAEEAWSMRALASDISLDRFTDYMEAVEDYVAAIEMTRLRASGWRPEPHELDPRFPGVQTYVRRSVHEGHHRRMTMHASELFRALRDDLQGGAESDKACHELEGPPPRNPDQPR
jgi:hypothetical protein